MSSKQFNTKEDLDILSLEMSLWHRIMRCITLIICVFCTPLVYASHDGVKILISQNQVSDRPWTKFNGNNSVSNDDYDDMLLRSASLNEQLDASGNIWDRMREGFSLSGYEKKRVDAELSWYTRHQGYVDRVVDRAKPFIYYVLDEVEKRGMPAEIALLPVVESAFQPFAYSPGSAAGLWQFIAATGKRYGLKLNWWYDGRRDVYLSTQAALDFLTDLYEHFDGDWLLALAAYNSGQGNVDRAIRRNLKKGKDTDFWSLQLPKETRNYVPKLLAIAALVDDPNAFNIRLNPIPNKPYFERVPIGAQLDLALAAKLAGISEEELYSLNSGFNRWATAPDGPHYLLLPINKAEKFKDKLWAMEDQNRRQWQRHKVKPGETLGHIAVNYQTSTSSIRNLNGMEGSNIKVGDTLIVPIASNHKNKFLGAGNNQLKSTHRTLLQEEKIHHTIAKGDSISKIANKYNVSVQKIIKWNKMSANDVLTPGKKLELWIDVSNNNGSDKLVATNFTTPPKKATTRRINYKVRRGESLSHISKKFRVSVGQLRKWNSMNDSDLLQPGQHLTLYVDVTRFSEKI